MTAMALKTQVTNRPRVINLETFTHESGKVSSASCKLGLAYAASLQLLRSNT